MLDVCLGYGAHPDSAGELAPIISRAIAKAKSAGRYLEFVAIVSGTDEDPQDLSTQVQKLKDAGAVVETSNELSARYVGQLLRALDLENGAVSEDTFKKVELSVLKQPLAAINVGLESFTESMTAQQAQVIQVDWRPPASGNEKLMAILERMKRK